MYFFDHDPPHFRAAYTGAQARIRIRPLGVLGGTLPPRALALVVELASLREVSWRRLHADEPPAKIAPLE